MGENIFEIAYRNYFQAKKEDWQEIFLPFNEFLPTYRGRVLTNFPQLDPKKIKQFGFMITDKQVGNFNLEIDWIGVY
jgi:monofunctional biosynthetic peptidoglycan transglycosylase